MAFLEKTVPVGTTDTELYVCPATLSGSAHGLIFSNITAVGRTITLKLFSQLSGLTTQITGSGQVIPANGQFTWPKPINLVAGDKIIASADTANSVVAVVAVFLDQAAQPSSAFVPRGTWSSIANYVVNDVVVAADGTSYLAVVANLNSAPPSTDWMVLALKGATGIGITEQTVGWTGTGGTTPKTLTVALDANVAGTNTGDQSSIVGITGTISEFNTAVTDADLATLAANTFTGEQNLADNNLTRPKFKDVSEELSVIGNVGATRTFDLTVANAFTATVDQISTFTFSNPPATGSNGSFTLFLTNGGAFAVTWPASVDWVAATAPTLTAAGVDVLVFTTNDAGTTWLGFVVGLAVA